MNIGIYCGSFNPPHIGHATMAAYIAGFVDEIDELWLLASPQNPLKSPEELAPERHRMAMTRLLAHSVAGVKASDFELSLPTPSYTFKTLESLTAAYPEHKFSLIIGSDNWTLFDRWKNPEQIISRYGVWIYPRPGYDVDETSLPAGVRVIKDAPTVDISSTFLRRAIAEGRNVASFTPPGVAEYALAHNLYTHSTPSVKK